MVTAWPNSKAGATAVRTIKTNTVFSALRWASNYKFLINGLVYRLTLFFQEQGFLLNRFLLLISCLPAGNLFHIRYYYAILQAVQNNFSMRYAKWAGLAAAILLIISCFTPWVRIESVDITVSGIDTSGTHFGKPGYFHILLALLFTLCTFIQRVGAKRLNLFLTAFNLAWAIRNFLVLAKCQGGECPIRQTGIYLVLVASVLMLMTALFPDMKLPLSKNK